MFSPPYWFCILLHAIVMITNDFCTSPLYFVYRIDRRAYKMATIHSLIHAKNVFDLGAHKGRLM